MPYTQRCGHGNFPGGPDVSVVRGPRTRCGTHGAVFLFARRAGVSRWGVLGLLATGTMINYLDRTVLGVAAPALSAELKLSPEMLGIVLSAFSWSYAAAQLPGGWFLDRFGNKLTYFLAVTLWSLFTLLQ